MRYYTEKLKISLDNIKQRMFELIDNSRINEFKNDDPQFFFVAPRFYWDHPTAAELQIQRILKKEYGPWIESFRLLIENSPESYKRDIDEIDEFICNWIEKESDWSIPQSLTEAKSIFSDRIQPLYDTLSLYLNLSDRDLILIPDTNALLTEPEPSKYSSIIKSSKFTIIYLPTVLSELDKLKIKSNDPNFQKKVKSVISRLKGYRKQGNLIDGVIVHKTIKLKMIASEPNFNKTLKWLDKDNNDDKIIASALEIQKEYPSSFISIVTGDINLQNKAEMANFPYFDI